LIGYSYAEWSSQPTQAQGTSSELSQLSQSRSQVILPCPYRGLDAFRKEDAPFFCGRENFIEQLEVAVRKKPLVTVIGRSGSGKSSVVFAGLIPKLGQKKGWLIGDFRPEKRPFYNLAKALIPLLEPKMTETDKLVEVTKQAEALQQGDLALQDVVEVILPKKPSAQHFLLVVDQFEELYTLCPVAEERQQFLNQLVATVAAAQQKRTPNFTLLITLRDDFLGQAIDYPPFGEQLQQWKPEFILSMNPQELKDAIEKPAQKLDVQLQEGLTQIILDAVNGEPGSLPLLEFALKLLWEKQSDGKLTHAAYEEIGGVEKALANHAEKVYQKLTEDEQQRVQHIFTQLVRPGAGTEDTRRLATRAEVREDNWELVTYLANQDARLVVTGRDEATGEATVEVVHEALIRGWERLRQWMEADREFRTWQERLRVAMQIWENSQRDEGALLRGALLVEAETWVEQRADVISPAEKEFIQTSREHQAQEEQHERELRRQAEVSEIDALNSLSQAQLLLHDQLGALVTAVKAGRKLQETEAPFDEIKRRTVDGLRQAIFTVKERNRFEGHSDWVVSVSLSPDGQMIASASSDKTVRLWRIDGTLVQTFEGHKQRVERVSFSPNGQMIASVSCDKTVKLWRLDGTPPQTFQGHSDSVWDVSFSPDGQMIASASDDKTLRLWQLDGTPPQIFEGHSDRVYGVSFSPDGEMIVSASADNTVKLWWLDGTLRQSFEGHEDRVLRVSFSPDGQMIASASSDKTVRLWRIDGTHLRTFEGHGDLVYSVKFSPDGQSIVSASADKTVRLWRLDGTLVQTFEGHGERIYDASFSLDGQTIASASGDKTLRLWQFEKTILKGHSNQVWGVSFSPDGRIIASASWDKTVKLWQLDGKPLLTFQGHGDSVNSVSFSPDGHMLVSASKDKTVKLWHCNGTPLHTFEGHDDEVYAVSFSPDGQTIASVSSDKDVKLWHCNGTLLQTFKGSGDVFDEGHNGLVSGICFSPDGQMLASASVDKTVRLWHLDGTLQRIFVGHSDWVYGVSFSPDGQMLASASYDKTVRLWQLDGTLLQTFEGHSDWVYGVSFSPDGQMIASASADKTLRLWRLDGKLLQIFQGHNERVYGVSFSPDGQMIASASYDKTVRLWRLDGTEGILDLDVQLDNLLMRGCNWLSDYLKTNPNVSESDRHLCDGICTQQ
jgi:WD40 repeat protein/energy-coupling factor transporter ATP-binding protein EcfA2